MSYNHGITLIENPTSIQQPLEALSAVQVVFGTAPINLVAEPEKAVNQPLLVRSFDEAKTKLGYSDDWNSYTLCEVMDASFKQFKVSPVVFINVLDPTVHKINVPNESVTITNKQALVDENGVLLKSLVVKSADELVTYEENKDYVVAFNKDAKPLISVLGAPGTIPVSETTLQVTYDKLDPAAVTSTDIVGGYDDATGVYSGLELVQKIYPSLNVVPNLLLAPGFSHDPIVGHLLVAKSTKINGSFNASNLIDLNGKNKEEAMEYKATNSYNDKSSFFCWPKVKIGDKTYHYSSVVAATIARVDAENENVPYKSPSNKKIPISATVNAEGKEISLDQIEGNALNAKGIVTAININGFRVWGNNTGAFDADLPGVMDPKDRFIAVRRMFDWWGNTFILSYFDRVDEPANFRLIESIVDGENIRANGFQAKGQIAGARIEFRQEDNPASQILDGKIRFIQKIAFFTPAEEIINVLEFDPTILTESLFGGE